MKPSEAVYAVLTGDVVKSSAIAPDAYDALLYLLDQSLVYISELYQAHYSLYRGDSFQLLLKQPEHALYSCFILRLSLKAKGYDARISIGIGTVSNLRPDMSTSTGQAFTLSGRGLELLQHHRMALFCTELSPQPQLDLLLRYADVLLSQLSSRQAAIFLEYLKASSPSHQQIADQLNNSRVNITRLLNQAHYQLQLDLLQHFAQWIKENIDG